MNSDRINDIQDAWDRLDIPASRRSDSEMLRAIRARSRSRSAAENRRRQVAFSAIAALLVGALVIVGLQLIDRGSNETAGVAEGTASAQPLNFSDGSLVHPGPNSLIVVQEANSARLRVSLEHGSARFDVAHDPERVFEVTIGSARVLVVGTRFDVVREEAAVRVEVESGAVQLTSESHDILLQAGEQARVLIDAPASDASASLDEFDIGNTSGQMDDRQAALDESDIGNTSGQIGNTSGHIDNRQAALDESDIGNTSGQMDDRQARAPVREALRDKPSPRTAPRERPARAEESWRDHAARGDAEAAAELVERAPNIAGVEDLMLAADVMRLSGRNQEALRYLDRVLSEHESDARAPLAAFTRARLLLDRMGDAPAAASAFEAVTTRYPNAPIAEHALAGAVEAYHRAGQTDAARETALRYIQRYPDGPRADVVRLRGGL